MSAHPQYQQIKYELSERILTITLNRPDKRNAVTFLMADELRHALARADDDDDVGAVIITGEKDFFCAGVDLASPGGMDPNSAKYVPMEGRSRDRGGLLTQQMYELRKLVIVAFNGPAIGFGVGVSLPADIRLAVEDTRFAIPMVRRGFTPESSQTWFLPRIVGISRALEWAITGRYIPAAEALEAGLVRELLPRDRLLPRAREIAKEVVENCAPVAVALTRAMMWQNLDQNLNEANRIDTLMLLSLARSADTAEGVAAFLQKRKPDFPLKVSRDMPGFYPWWKPRDSEMRYAPLLSRHERGDS